MYIIIHVEEESLNLFTSWSWPPVMKRLIKVKHMTTTSQWLTRFLRTCCLLLLWSGQKPHGNHMAPWSTSSCTEIARSAEGRDCFWAVYFVSHIFAHSRVLCLKHCFFGIFWVHLVEEKRSLKHLHKVGKILTLVSNGEQFVNFCTWNSVNWYRRMVNKGYRIQIPGTQK